MPEKDGKPLDTKQELPGGSSIPASSIENYEELPNTKHDLTAEEFRDILKFINSEEMRKKGMNDEYKIFLKMRWLKAVLHLENESEKNRRYWSVFSVIALIASAITTALAGANFADAAKLCPTNLTTDTLRGVLFILSLTVTIVVGLMNLFKFDEVHWKKRIYAEKLKAEGFQFLQLIGGYSNPSYNEEVYKDFAKNVEKLIKEVNEGYTNLFGGNAEK